VAGLLTVPLAPTAGLHELVVAGLLTVPLGKVAWSGDHATTGVAPLPATQTSLSHHHARERIVHEAMANFRVDPSVVEPWVPRGTILDVIDGHTYLSIVGFLFRETRVLGLSVPFHRNFEEVNLRLYVRREINDEVRRGVVFLKELVPRWAVSTVARAFYNENYATLPMRHDLHGFDDDSADTREIRYQWRLGDRWHALHMQVNGPPAPLRVGSHEEFITEHYWGYCRQRDGGTVEYHVEHPSWHVWHATKHQFDCDVERLYGPSFASALTQPPVSTFVADGSPVHVHKPVRIC
jgi:uncharacterized protein YqjF (DUF2071 family)